MSWESSLEYYRMVNEGVKARLGGLHSARCVLLSLNFAEVEALQRDGLWDAAAARLGDAAAQLERAGADFVLICSNTMHKVAEAVEARLNVPLLHIADPTADLIRSRKLTRIGLLGTRFTMEEPFYRGRLEQRHGLEIMVPEAAARETIHRVIYQELCLGQIRADSRREYARIMGELAGRGAEGIILGCTEIGLLVSEADSPVPLFDTTRIHAEAAVEQALS
jgi:aspartate racemase